MSSVRSARQIKIGHYKKIIILKFVSLWDNLESWIKGGLSSIVECFIDIEKVDGA